MEDRAIRSLWCDGFIPRQYLLDDPTPRVTGSAWIGFGPRKQERWEFTLFLHQPARAREAIPWGALFPSDEVTGWLGVDLEGRRLRITPSREATP
jgi:hypothetical protein